MFTFLKKCDNFYAGEGSEWYEVIASTTDKAIAGIINNSLPNRIDKEKIVCVLIDTTSTEQYHDFDYQFTHEFNKSLEIF